MGHGLRTLMVSAAIAAVACACGGQAFPKAPTVMDAPESSDGAVTTLTFVSDATWTWYPGGLGGVDGGALGHAAVVCLNAMSPPDCPANAILCGWSGTQWSVNTSTIPTAQWIWRGDVSSSGLTNLDFAVLQKTFTLGSSPAGTLEIVADNYAEVQVNGSVVGSVGSVTDQARGQGFQLSSFDLSTHLIPGTNTITIIGQNGPNSWPECYGPCTYAQNPAGVLFGGSLTYR